MPPQRADALRAGKSRLTPQRPRIERSDARGQLQRTRLVQPAWPLPGDCAVAQQLKHFHCPLLTTVSHRQRLRLHPDAR